MRRRTTGGLALALLFAIGCRGGDSYESLVKSQIELLGEKAKILEGVKDRDSARKARPGLEEVNNRLKEIDQRRSRLAKDRNQDGEFAAAFNAQRNNAVEFRRVHRRLEAARKKALKNKEVAAVLKGINLE